MTGFGPGWDALRRFVGELNQLRLLSGSPSLNRLVELAADAGQSLPRSTVSDKLNAKSLPDWDFVASFVAACQVHAAQTGRMLPSSAVDIASWGAAHLRMLQEVDRASDESRLMAAARAELGRRDGQALTHPASAAPEGRRTGPVSQLPPAVRHFVGRDQEARFLNRLIAQTSETAATVVISAVHGMAGIGKTTLALHWAHWVADRFPDGRLYVNLRGFDPAGVPKAPGEALRDFLDALEVPPEKIPSSVDAQAAMYRSLLTGRRVLVVLDNARDEEQVRPLLPGSAGCLALVTSRRQLTGLVCTEDAQSLTLSLLPATAARSLLGRRLGWSRITADPRGVDEIVASCAGLPLALSIVAARAAIRPEWSMSAIAAELRSAGGGLAALEGGEPATDLRAVFSWSYDALTEPAARLFRLLGLHPGPDLDASAAASLAGTDPGSTRSALTELARAHLIWQPVPGRLVIAHDLLRAYAIELVKAVDSDTDRQAAVHRLVEHYLRTAHTADRLLYPQRTPVTLGPPDPGVTAVDLAGPDQAVNWFTEGRHVLLGILTLAADAGLDSQTWQLARTLQIFFDRRGYWDDLHLAATTALPAASRSADRAQLAAAHRRLSWVCIQLGRFDDAQAHLRHAGDLAAELSDRTAQAKAQFLLAVVFDRQGRYGEALRAAETALDNFRAAGNAKRVPVALNMVGWCRVLLGDYKEALASCQQALALHQENGDRYGQAAAWDSLGYAHQHLGHPEAVGCYRHAVELFRETGDRYSEADTLDRLGDTQHAADNPDQARDAWRQALAIFDDLDHSDAEPIRRKLDGLAHDLPPRTVLDDANDPLGQPAVSRSLRVVGDPH